MAIQQPARGFGELLREWREHRRLSQMELALDAEISTRHLSFVETSRSQPSREMVLRLAEQLDVPLRERNHLLLAAGYAPVYGETPLDSPSMAAVRETVRTLLAAHEPFPALVVDRAWNLVEANRSLQPLLVGIDPALFVPPVNVLRLALHPGGLASRIVNLGEWRGHLLGRLKRQAALTADPQIAALYEELRAYPCDQPEPLDHGAGEVMLILRLRHEAGELTFFTTIATFGTPADVTVSELAIESFYPADPRTAEILRAADVR